MAVQDNKKAGFLTPIKPVEVSSSTGNPRLKDNQRVQGGQKLGGGQDNTNNAGNTGVQSQPFMSEGQSKIVNKIASIGTPPSTVQPSIYNPLNNSQEQFKAGLNNSNITPNLNKVVSGSRSALVAPTPTPVAPTPTPVAPISPAVFKEPDFSNPSISVIASPQDQRVFSTASQDRNLGESKGSGGSIQYARDPSGNILRRDDSGSITKLGGISSIGPNGTNSDGSPLSARDQAALDRSNQMVSDWKAQKERAGYQKIIDTELSKPFRNTRLIGEATDKLTALDTNDTNRAQIASQEELNARTLGTTARKNAFEEQLNTQKLGVDLAKATSEAQGRLASQQNDTFKLIGEVDKNLGSTQDKVAVYKSRGMWNPLTIKASYPREKLGSFKTPDELRQNLVNDESIDQGDIEDIVFSYFPNNQ